MATKPMFSNVDNPDINDAGQVCFSGTLPNGDRGVFVREPSGATTTIALGSKSDFDQFFSPLINEAGTVVFDALLRSGARGFFMSEGGKTRMLASIDPSDRARFSLNNSGAVAFTTSSGVFIAKGGVVSKVAGTGGPTDPFEIVGNVSINSAEGIAFYASARFPDGQRSSGIYTGADVNADRVVGNEDLQFDGIVLSTYLGVKALNDAGQIAIIYVLRDFRMGIGIATPAA